jgi:hypothetical protein
MNDSVGGQILMEPNSHVVRVRGYSPKHKEEKGAHEDLAGSAQPLEIERLFAASPWLRLPRDRSLLPAWRK